MAAEEGDTREPVTKEVRFLVPIEKNQAEPKRISYGVVLEPDTEDLQGDVMTAEDIETAAYDWMERSQAGGHMHSQLVEGAKVVESYIAPCDIPIETAEGRDIIRKGSWVLAMRWPEEIWDSITKGQLTGYSVGGTGVRVTLDDVGKHADHDQKTHGNWARGGRTHSPDSGKDGGAREEDGRPTSQYAVGDRVEITYSRRDDPKDITATGTIRELERPSRFRYADHLVADLDNGETLRFDADEPDAVGLWSISRLDDAARAAREEADWKAGYGQDASQGWEAEAGYRTFNRGQKVRTRTGEIRTVHSQRGSQVWVEEESNSWHHPNNLRKVYWSNELGWVAIPDREDEVKKHGSGDQTPHGNWAHPGRLSDEKMREEYGDHDDTGPLGDDEEFVPGDRVKLISNEKMDWGGLEGATGKISEVKPGTLGWPTVYSVKLDREWVGFEDEDTIHDLEADRLTMLGRVGSPGSGGMTDPEDEDVWYTYTTQIDSEGRERQVRVPVPKLMKSLTDAVREGLQEAVVKHGHHDQTSHGNWARGWSSPEFEAEVDRGFREAVGLAEGDKPPRSIKPGIATLATETDMKTIDGEEVASFIVAQGDDANQTFARVYAHGAAAAAVAAARENSTLMSSQIELTGAMGPDGAFHATGVKFVPDADERRVAKHGSGDQTAHGNWARDSSAEYDEDPPYEKDPFVGDVDASRSSSEMKSLLTRGYATLDGVKRNTDGTYTATRVFSKKGQFDSEARFARAIEYAAGQQNLDVRILGADEYNERKGEGGRFEIRFAMVPKESTRKSLTEIVREGFEEVAKHGTGDQKPHGNWARGGTQQTPRERSWERHLTAPTPEERRRAGEDYVRYADAEDAAMVEGSGKKHVTRDGIVIEDQPKVTRVGGEQYQIAKPEGQVILNFGEWKWTGTGTSPQVTERGSWAVWPRHKKHNLDNLIRSSNRTIAELMRDLPPGEYDLAP